MTEDYNSKLEIELMKKDVSVLSRLCEKYDVTIEKMQEVASNLTKIVTVQEQKLDSQEKINKEFDNALDKQNSKIEKDYEDINLRITKVNTELTTKIEQVELAILNEIQHLKNEVMSVNTNLNKRVSEIDMWRYMIMGGIALFVFLVSNFLGLIKFK